MRFSTTISNLLLSATFALLASACGGGGGGGGSSSSQSPNLASPNGGIPTNPVTVEAPADKPSATVASPIEKMSKSQIDSYPDMGWIEMSGTSADNTNQNGTLSVQSKNDNGHGNDDHGDDDKDDHHGDKGHGNDDHDRDYDIGDDDHLNLKAINLNIISVSVHEVNGTTKLINNKPQTIDLVALSKNAVSVLASQPIPPGRYDAILLKLSDNSNIVINTKTYPLKVPSGTKSGLKLVGYFEIKKGYVTSISLRFNAEKSVHVYSRNKYMLKPVIKINELQEDVFAPNIAFTDFPDAISNHSDQLISLSYSDEYLDLSSLSVLINGVETKSKLSISESGATGTINLVDGKYVLQSFIKDLNKNVGIADAIEFMVDTTKPIIAFKQENQYFKASNPNLEIEVSDNLSLVDDNTLNVKINGVDVTDQFTWDGSKLFGSPNLTEGEKTILVQAKDIAGNLQSLSSKFTIDLTPAILTQNSPLTSKILYTNNLPFSFNAEISSNEVLSSISINGLTGIFDDSKTLASQVLTLNSAGPFSLPVTAEDLAKNQSSLDLIGRLILDQVNPVITITYDEGIRHNDFEISVPVKIEDSSPTWTEIRLNSQQILSTGSKDFSVLTHPNLEGENTFLVLTTDAAGNTTQSSKKIIIDRTPAVLAITKPLANSQIRAMSFEIQGTSNEPLKDISVNGMKLNLGTDGTSFSGTFVAEAPEVISLGFLSTDLAGNESTKSITVEVINPVLYGQLISVKPANDNNHLIIKGTAGSSRPGIRVSASTGFFGFNDDSKVSNPDGSFTLVTKVASVIHVKGEDLETNEKANFDVNFDLNTTLSGVVFDTDGNPLPGISVKVAGTQFQTVSDGTGSFEFQNVVSGDQTIQFDGTNAVQPSGGAPRTFSITAVKLNIGLGQRNTLNRPVYLAAIPLDGSGTQIIAGSSTVVTSDEAPGVRIEIAANTAELPPQISSKIISIKTVPAQFATIAPPQQAEPTNVISLEPSGLTFSKRAKITIPNDNELPDGTEVILISMNSLTGQWELDGRGKVDQGGASITTNPNEGISHFSLVYAIPLAPVISEVGDPNVQGIDIGKGSLTTAITTPSYKSIDKTVAPGLVYKSAWAKPTAFVSNRIDIPPMKSEATITERSFFYKTECSSMGCDWGEAKVGIFNTTTINDQSMYVPDQIKSQVFIGSLKSGTVNFIDSTEVPDNRDKVIPGPLFNDGINSQIVSMKGIPNNATISYAVPLKDQETNEYLANGIYPYIARYEIRLKNLVIRSITSKTDLQIDGKLENSYPAFNQYRYTSAIQQVLPKDVVGSVLLKSRIKSEFGRGWDLNLTQKITNPGSQRLMIEESTGDVSTYGMQNTISTLMTAGANDDLTQGSSIHWPMVSFVRKNSSGDPEVFEKRLDSDIAATLKFKPASNNIQWADQNQVSCPDLYGRELRCPYVSYVKYPETTPPGFSPSQGEYQNNKNAYGYYASYRIPATIVPTLAGVTYNSDGSILYINSKDHSIWRGGGIQFSKIAGSEDTIDQVYGGSSQAINVRFDGSDYSAVQNFCQTNFGKDCGTANYVQTNSCVFVAEGGRYNSVQRGCDNAHPYPGCLCNIFDVVGRFKVIDSIGGIGVPRYSGDDAVGALTNQATTIGFNNPTQIVPYFNGTYLVADTGNNRVRLLNLNTNTVSTFAGDGSNFDQGDQIDAKLAKIYHPKSLLVLQNGDVLIGSESGYIRKVDQNGIISVLAGLPVNAGGNLSEEGPISTFALNNPSGMVMDEENNILYVSDTNNNRVVKLNFTTERASVVAGNGQCVLNPVTNDDVALNHSLCGPTTLALDSNKNLIINDMGHNQIKRLNQQANANSVLSYQPSSRDGSVISKSAEGTFLRTYRDGSTVKFDAAGKQTELKDPFGRTTTFEYNSDNLLTKMTDAVGSETILEYSGKKLLSIKDPANRRTSFSYSGELLTQVTYPDGSQKIYEYDDQGLMTKEIDPRGAQTKYTYNAYDRLQTVTNALNDSVTVNDMVSGTMTNDYTGGQTGTFKKPGTEEGAAQDKITDAKNSSVELAKDFNGFIWKMQDAEGKLTYIFRNAFGQPTLISLPDGSITKMTYDPTTRDLLSKTDVTNNISESYIYNSKGQVTQKTDGLGKVSTRTFESTKGLLTQENFPGGITTTYGYTSLGQVAVKTVFPTAGAPVAQSWEYDNKGNAIRIFSSDGKDVRFVFDNAGNVIQSIKQAASGQVITNFEYDLMNRLTKVTNPNGDITRYQYLPTGELSKIIAPNNKETVFEYNVIGKLTKKIETNGAVRLFSYDKNGNLIQETDPNGNIKILTYDQSDKLTQVQLPDDLITYEYNTRGEVTATENNISRLSMIRDSRKRVVLSRLEGKGSLADYPVVDLNYIYNENDQMTAMQSAVKNIGYSYDSANRLSSISTSSGDSYSFQYDNANRLTQINRPGSRSNFIYTASQMVDSIIHSSNGVTKSYWQYGYDDRNLPISKRGMSGQNDYSYDGNSQLTGGTVPLSTAESFSYDSLGNRITDENGSYVYDQNQDLLLEDWQFSYSYDANGNMTMKSSKIAGKPSYKMEYSSKNQLVKIQELPDLLGSQVTKEIFYSYDVTGRRIEKKIVDYAQNPASIKTRRDLYDGENILAEYDGSNQLLATFTHSPLRADDVLGMNVTVAGVSAGFASVVGNVYYLKDMLGSITDIADGAGNILQKYEYSSFGKILSIKNGAGTDVTSNPVVRQSFTFTGREWDEESGLYFYRARTYDASIGRFLQRDPDPGNLNVSITAINKYTFGGNQPISHIDPTGESFWDIVITVAVIAAVIYTGGLAGSFVGGAIGGAAGTAFSSAAIGGITGAISGAIAGAIVGGITGAAIGAVSYSMLGRDAAQGAMTFGTLGAIVGGMAGGLSGYKAGYTGQSSGNWLWKKANTYVNDKLNSFRADLLDFDRHPMNSKFSTDLIKHILGNPVPGAP